MANKDKNSRSEKKILIDIEGRLRESEKFSAAVFGITVVAIGGNFAIMADNCCNLAVSFVIMGLGAFMAIFVGFAGKRFSIRHWRIFITKS